MARKKIYEPASVPNLGYHFSRVDEVRIEHAKLGALAFMAKYSRPKRLIELKSMTTYNAGDKVRFYIATHLQHTLLEGVIIEQCAERPELFVINDGSRKLSIHRDLIVGKIAQNGDKTN